MIKQRKPRLFVALLKVTTVTGPLLPGIFEYCLRQEFILWEIDLISEFLRILRKLYLQINDDLLCSIGLTSENSFRRCQWAILFL